MEVSKDNIAYVGYEFGCSWDDEHGIGFMTHKDRIIDFGGADTSFLTWVAEKDLKPKKIKKALTSDKKQQATLHWRYRG